MNTDTPLTLTAGPLSVVIYRGEPRYISINGIELVRRIFFGVRDTTWGTASIDITQFECDPQPDGFSVRYHAVAQSPTSDFHFNAVIRAKATEGDVSLSMEVEGAPQSTLTTNRTGLSVLHPIAGLTGKSCEVETPNGRIMDAAFPVSVSPDCLFSRIQALNYRTGGLAVTVRLYGDLFETEDQRNWADTSFKTYSRPLAEPRPYTIEAGQIVRQAVSVVVKPSRTESPESQSTPLIRLSAQRYPLPALGLRMSPGQPIAPLIQSLNLSHLRVDAGAEFDGWKADLRTAADSGVPIELAAHVAGIEELNHIATVVAAENVRLARVFVYESGRPLPDPALVSAAKLAFSGAAVGPGTVGNFAEINRNRSRATSGEMVTYAVNPQVHAMDDLSIMENLPSLGDAVDTLREFCTGTVAVGPITLHRVADPFSAGSDGRVAAATPDARQGSQLAAAWTVGVVKYLAERGVSAATLFETAGPSGLLASDGSPWPLYHVLAAVCEFAGGEVIPVSDPAPLHAIALAMTRNGRLRIIVANTRWEEVRINVDRIGPMTLPAYGVRIFDLPADGAFQS